MRSGGRVMSYLLAERVSNSTILPPGKRTVARIFADHANEDGTEARPSITTVARQTGMTERQVYRFVRSLRDDKVMVLDWESPGATSVYHFNLDLLGPTNAELREQRTADRLAKRAARLTPVTVPPLTPQESTPNPCHDVRGTPDTETGVPLTQRQGTPDTETGLPLTQSQATRPMYSSSDSAGERAVDPPRDAGGDAPSLPATFAPGEVQVSRAARQFLQVPSPEALSELKDLTRARARDGATAEDIALVIRWGQAESKRNGGRYGFFTRADWLLGAKHFNSNLLRARDWEVKPQGSDFAACPTDADGNDERDFEFLRKMVDRGLVPPEDIEKFRREHGWSHEEIAARLKPFPAAAPLAGLAPEPLPEPAPQPTTPKPKPMTAAETDALLASLYSADHEETAS